MLRKLCLAAVLALPLAFDLPLQAAPLPAAGITVVAQANPPQQEERRSSRSNRGMVKLGIAAICGVFVVGGWAIKKMRGES